MALRRVPGVRNYFADDRGLKEISLSPRMKAYTLEVAERIAGNANAVGESKYEAESRTVRVGWDNEPRAGAVAKETERHWRDSRDAVLVRVVQAMAIRRKNS